MLRVCFLIPAYNEAKVLSRSIRGAVDAGVSVSDIYVVDDGSKDDTANVARSHGVNVLTKPNGGKSAALESGLSHFALATRYTHIAVLDADSIIDPGYVRAMEQATRRHPKAVLFCGRQCSQRGPWNWLTSYRAVDYAVWCGVYREAQHATATVNVAPGFASMYQSATFASLDFHGGTVTEDMDMTLQLQRRRAEIVYVPDALVATQDPLKLRDFVGQMMRWYRGTWQCIKKHRLGRRAQAVDLEVTTLIAEQMVVGAIVFTLPLWLYLFPTITLIGLACDQAIALLYATLTAVRERRPELLLFFPTYWIPRLLGYALFSWAFLLECRRQETSWFSVKRY
jgi:cellulose synthase/poly-beta-1,6-N-acetylglucosamine synthase-like glycosyltransferase